MNAIIPVTAALGRTRRRWSLVFSIAIALSFAPRLLLAETIVDEQGNQVVRTGDIQAAVGKQIAVRDLGSKLDIQGAFDSITVVPEPSPWVLAAIALLGLALAMCRGGRTLTTMNRTAVVGLALLASLSLNTSAARADLAFDLRAVSGSQIVIHGPKSIAVNQNSVGGRVDFELYAFVNGHNGTATDESIHSFLGNMLSTHIGRGAASGSMDNAGEVTPRIRRGIVPPMDHVGSSDGWLQNLDGDPDLEIGGTGWQHVEGQGIRESTNGMVAGRGDPFRVRNYEGRRRNRRVSALPILALNIESVPSESLTDMTSVYFTNGPLWPRVTQFGSGRLYSFTPPTRPKN